MYQRSADVGLGVPYNIASYSLLTYIISVITKLTPYKLIIYFGDLHIYNNHLDQLQLQIKRTSFLQPTITINNNIDIDNLKFEDVVINGYKSHPFIKMDMAV